MSQRPRVIGIIPARYASTRLPGKPLLLIAGKPMIQRTYESAKKAKSLDSLGLLFISFSYIQSIIHNNNM